MKKLILSILTLLMSVGFLSAQTPMYSNGNPASASSGNSIPMSYTSTGNRGQELLPANVFGMSVPNGMAIERLYFSAYPFLTAPNPAQYGTLKIEMKQDNLTSLNTGQWQTGMTTVLDATNLNIPMVPGQWFSIDLDNPFTYDPNVPLIIDITAQQSPFSNWYRSFLGSASAGADRIYATSMTAPSPSGYQVYEFYTGIDLISLDPNNAGIAAILDPTSSTCAGQTDVEVVVQNFGINQVSPVTIEWEVNGTPQTPFVYNGVLDTVNGSGSTSDTIVVGNFNFVDSSDVKIWTTMPNNVPDTNNENDTMYLEWYASNPQIDLDDRTICEGSFDILNAGATWESVEWSTNSTNEQIVVTTAGVYGVTVTDEYGCTDEDQILVDSSATPSVSFEEEIEACGSYVLNAENSGSTYTWNTGETGQILLVEESGAYVVTIENAAGCIGVAQSVVTINPLPSLNLGEDFELCIDLHQSRILGGGNYSEYEWSTGANTNNFVVTAVGQTPGQQPYSVTVTDANDCSNSDTVTVTFKNCIPAGQQDIVSASGMSVYPNPAVDMVSIDINGLDADNVTVTLVDLNGRIINTLYNGSADGALHFNADLKDVARGVYNIKATNGSDEYIKPVVLK